MWIQDAIPYDGITPQSRHTSRLGAEDAAVRALTQTHKYLRALQQTGSFGLTDAEAAAILKIERTSVNARRVPLVKAGVVVPGGYRMGPTKKIRNVAWRLA